MINHNIAMFNININIDHQHRSSTSIINIDDQHRSSTSIINIDASCSRRVQRYAVPVRSSPSSSQRFRFSKMLVIVQSQSCQLAQVEQCCRCCYIYNRSSTVVLQVTVAEHQVLFSNNIDVKRVS